jgi:AcrR family transcriptional regulator
MIRAGVAAGRRSAATPPTCFARAKGEFEMISTAQSTDGRHIRSRSTRERILVAAEQLYADLGFAHVTLRDIGLAAGQKNNGAVQYHFQDRDNLILQIVIYRSKSIEEVRHRLLAEAGKQGTGTQVRDYVEAFIVSLATSFGDGNYFLRFLSRLVVDRGSIPIEAVPAGEVEFIRSTMRSLLPHLSDELINERWNVLMFSAVHMLASYQAAIGEGTLPCALEQLLADLVNFLTAGLEAPAATRALALPRPAHADADQTRKSRNEDSIAGPDDEAGIG